MSKVSVVVPIYNAEKKLDKCIKSILNQTFKEFELILVNDGSKDNSLHICEKYKQKDDRIFVIDQNNEGSNKARRNGVEASNSEFIMFADADDWIDKYTIETLYNEIVETKVDIIVCNMYRVLGFIKEKNKNSYFQEDKVYNQDEIKRKLLIAYFQGDPFPSSLCAKLYKKELLMNNGKYLDRIHFFGDDLFYNMEVFLKANKVKIIDKPLYYYRLGGGFTSKYMPYFFQDIINGYQIQKEVIEEYYADMKQYQLNGIGFMLLNLFKSGLYYLYLSKLDESEMKDIIKTNVNNHCVREALINAGSNKFFDNDYVEALKKKDIDYLYALGGSIYKKKKAKKVLMNIISNISL